MKGNAFFGRRETVTAWAANPVVSSVVACWALLLGMAGVMLGNGLQGSLLGLRGMAEGFSKPEIGLIMSGYFTGFMAGSMLTPRLLSRVGHVRVFAALSSLVSAAALLHVIYILPSAWLGLRFMTGFCFAGLFIVAESWLNDRISNQNRGQLLSVYMIVTLGSMGCGPLLLNVADIGGFKLFVLVSILFSIALVPILLSAQQVPGFEAPEPMSYRSLYRKAPLGVAGCLATGISNGALIGMGAVYAETVGLTLAQISLFMSLGILGAIVFQWPLGVLSDRYDRRMVLTVVTFCASIAAMIGIFSHASVGLLFGVITVFGGLSFPLYSLSLASTNDHLTPEQIVAASSSLVLTTGVGATISPLLAAWGIAHWGGFGFFGYLALIHLALGAFALERMRRFPAVPLEEQGPSVFVAPRSSPVVAAAAFETDDDHQ